MTRNCCTPAPETEDLVPPKGVPASNPVAPENLVSLLGGTFRMGAPSGEGYVEDGEGPPRVVRIASFSISKYTVTNREFAQFVNDTGYRTTAEIEGWSHVFHMFLSSEQRRNQAKVPAETPWWFPTKDACWYAPEGVGSDVARRQDHPVVHVSWHDAVAYCEWRGCTLPTEAQWEFAARAGSEEIYSWGSILAPNGKHMCNIWQGRFPGLNSADDGYVGTAPVDAFPPNAFGLHNMTGNVWEWCADAYSPDYHKTTSAHEPRYTTETGTRTARGGSFLCHESYCNRYRPAARIGNSPNTTCSNLGFRVSI